jgi:hypothetical protein
VEAMVHATVAAAAPFTAAATQQYTAQHHALFELVRFDVVVNTALKPWLLEVRTLTQYDPAR